jgi:dTDP-4-dehydrorhamnose reductase
LRVLICGAGGIVGQHMLLSKPGSVGALFCRRTASQLYQAVDLTDDIVTEGMLKRFLPHVIVNLAGQNDVDAVERSPDAVREINVEVPERLAGWCDRNGAHYVHVSTQGVFAGDAPPYSDEDIQKPVNEYGRQKTEAEYRVVEYSNWTIARLTFVVGVRPFPSFGRANPAEAILAGLHRRQVRDRFFSPLFALDAAVSLWGLVETQPKRHIVHLGTPLRKSRYELAGDLLGALERRGREVPVLIPTSHDDFPGISDRPYDTTWGEGALTNLTYEEGIEMTVSDWLSRENLDIAARAREVGLFLKIDPAEAESQLALGFHHHHAGVAADFREANPQTPEELLDWYRATNAYIWELSAYHLDAGFNYLGMCEGIAAHCRANDLNDVLCLGDGIGDLTVALSRAGLNPSYHDLEGSRTAAFAESRFELLLSKKPETWLTCDWEPVIPLERYDAVVALDFFEHVKGVEKWAAATIEALRPGGWLLCQNAFAIGDDEHGGSIPCHLVENNHFEHDWNPLLESLGMTQVEGGWWRKGSV